MKRNEWELVREFLKRQRRRHDEALPVVHAQVDHAPFHGDGADVDIDVSPVAVAVARPVTGQVSVEDPPSSFSLMDSIRAALAQHDQTIGMKLQNQRLADEKSRAREEWARKNMGLAMYPIDAAVDLATAMIPKPWRKKIKGKNGEDGIKGIVPVMS
jgi:hypothetical protein